MQIALPEIEEIANILLIVMMIVMMIVIVIRMKLLMENILLRIEILVATLLESSARARDPLSPLTLGQLYQWSRTQFSARQSPHSQRSVDRRNASVVGGKSVELQS